MEMKKNLYVLNKTCIVILLFIENGQIIHVIFNVYVLINLLPQPVHHLGHGNVSEKEFEAC